MGEYFCPYCEAVLNEQYGFDPDSSCWVCTECGTQLMDDDMYCGDEFEGVVWRCDCCGALLNKQLGFSDALGSWVCTDCFYTNPINEDVIYESEEEYEKSKQSCDEQYECPNCGGSLNSQYGFSGYEYSWKCSECGVFLQRQYNEELFELVEEDKTLDDYNSDEEDLYFSSVIDWISAKFGTRSKESEDIDKCAFSYDENDKNSCGTCSDAMGCKWESKGYSNNRYYTSEVIRLPEKELIKKRIKSFIFNRKRIQMDWSYTDLIGKDIKYVELILHNQAFNNVKVIPIKDIYVNSNYSVGQVEQVVISRSSYFLKGDKIPYDAEIIVTYHVKKEITIPFSERTLRKLNYNDAVNKLFGLGFTEVYTKPLGDLITGWIRKEGTIEKVTVGDTCSFSKNNVFAYDVKILIEYHSFEKK